MLRPLVQSTLSLFTIWFALVAPAYGQKSGDGSIRLEHQFIRTGTFFSKDQEFDYWTTDTQVMVLSGDYAINNRWTAFASLPYVRKRFNSEVPWGGDPHDPSASYWVDYDPPNKDFWDDGDYHGGLQDFSAGISYRIDRGPFTLHPYVSFGVPATDYPFFAKAAIGANLWTIPVGTSISFVPYFSDWHFAGDIAYVFSEKPLGKNVDYWLAHLSAGYWFEANLSVNAFFSLKYARKGVSLLSSEFVVEDASSPPVYPDDYGTREWYNHDRLIKHRNLNYGIGVDYFISPEWKISGSGYRSIWTEESNEVDFAFTLGITRFFSGK
jgi:hypothetical protein